MFRTRRLALSTIGPRLALGLLALCAALPACVTRESRETLVDTNSLEVFLRSHKRGTREIEKGYDHPGTIAADRLVNILASIEVENIAGRGKQRRPLLARDVIESVADFSGRQFQDSRGKDSEPGRHQWHSGTRRDHIQPGRDAATIRFSTRPV